MIEKNPVFTKPTKEDFYNYLADNILINLNCHHLGTIQSFDPTTQTAVATIDYQKLVPQFSETTGLLTPILVPYPPLLDCPVYFDHGQGGGFTKPVAKGDKCLISFNDRDMDLWFAGVQNQAPNTGRLHGFSDALITVGFNPKTNPISNFDNTRPMLRDKTGRTIVALSADGSKVNIQNASKNLSTILQNLVSALNDLNSTLSTATAGGFPIVPTTGKTFAQIATEISAVSTDLGSLLT